MNVIMIMEDSLRKDHLGCYGNPWIKTPNIDRFAAESTVFEGAYGEGVPTLPVRAALLTGRYTIPFRGWSPIESKDLLLTDVLWDKGIRTSLITDTYQFLKPHMGYIRGFEFVEVIRGQEIDPAILDPSIPVDLSQYSARNWESAYSGAITRYVKKAFTQYLRNRASWKTEADHHIAQVVTSTNKWLEEFTAKQPKQDFLLWIDSFDPHEPWDPPQNCRDMYPVPDYDGLPITWGGGPCDSWPLEEIQHVRSQYAATVSMCDTWTGRLLEKISDLGLLENTMIVFLSDHGEPMGEHGIIKKVRPWPYDELSRIPLLIRLPDGMEHKDRIRSFVHTPDITTTILAFLGIKQPQPMHGVDLLPIIRGEHEAMEYGIAGYHGRSVSIRDHEWSFYVQTTATANTNPWWISLKDGETSQRELYHYDFDYVPPSPSKYQRGDQAEKEIITDQPDRAQQLETQLWIFIKAFQPSAGDLQVQDYLTGGHVDSSAKGVFIAPDAKSAF